MQKKVNLEQQIPGPTWGDLFVFIEKNLKMVPCQGGENIPLVKLFCQNNNLDFQRIALVLMEHGGFCDCEVVENARGELCSSMKLWFLYSNNNPHKYNVDK